MKLTVFELITINLIKYTVKLFKNYKLYNKLVEK